MMQKMEFYSYCFFVSIQFIVGERCQGEVEIAKATMRIGM